MNSSLNPVTNTTTSYNSAGQNQTASFNNAAAQRAVIDYSGTNMTGANAGTTSFTGVGQPMSGATLPNVASTNYSGVQATQPVVTSSSALEDYNAKLATFNSINASIAAQTDAKAKADLQQKADSATQALNASELNLKQQDLDRLKTESDAKLAAVKAATTGGTTSGNTGTDTTGNTGNTAGAGNSTTGNTGGTPNPSSPLKDEGSQYKSDITSIQGLKDTITQGIIDNLNNLKSGTIPLNASQQALISSVQTQLVQRENEQKVANSAYTGQVAEAGFRAGGEYTPEQYSGQIANAVSYGVAKIAELDATAAQTIAKMTTDFQQSNYDNINKGYDTLMKQLDDKANTITKLHDDTMSILKDERDQKQKVTDAVNKVAEEAAKNGADSKTMAAIQASKTEGDALNAAGNFLQTATGTQGEYLQYKRDMESKGLNPMSYEDYKYNDEYTKASATATAQSAATQGDENQQKLEQQYRGILAKEFSSRTGSLGVENAKVNQANHLNSLFSQYYDSKTGTYNIPAVQYSELALGLANLVSPTGVASDSMREAITQRTAKGDFNGAISYITGNPQNGTTQEVIKNLIDSVDRQAETATRNREAALQNMRDMAPTDLSQDRIDKLNKSTEMVKYEGQDRIDKSSVNTYVQSLPAGSTERENIAKMYEIPGTTDSMVAEWLKSNGKIN